MSEPNPYAPPSATIGDEAEPAATLTKASRGRRLLAKIVDSFVIVIAVITALLIATTVLGMERDPSKGVQDPVFLAMILFTSGLVGPVQLYLLLRRGQTIGKKVFRMRIVRVDGGRPNPWRLIGMRSLVPIVLGYVPVLKYLFGLADPLFIFQSDSRCIHDHMAGTIVVDLRPLKEETLRLGSIRPASA